MILKPPPRLRDPSPKSLHSLETAVKIPETQSWRLLNTRGFSTQDQPGFHNSKFTEMPTKFKYNCSTGYCGDPNFTTANAGSFTTFDETDMPLAEIIKLTFVVLIAFVGVIGNILVSTVVCTLGKKRKPTDLYVQHLAIADLGTLLLAFPLATIRLEAPLNWPFGEFGCLYLYPVPEIFHGASVWYIAVIAIERYRRMLTVKTPDQNKNKTLLKRAKTAAGFVWVTSFLIFCLPLYFVVDYRKFQNGDKWCGPVWGSPKLQKGYITLLTLFSYILPLIVISFSYLAISRTINRSNLFIKTIKREQQGTAQNEHNSYMTNVRSVRLEHNKRAKKILTPVVLVFAVTMLPLNIFRLTTVFWPAIAVQGCYKNLVYVVSLFVVLNSSANALIYSVVSRDFRRAIKNTVKFR